MFLFKQKNRSEEKKKETVFQRTVILSGSMPRFCEEAEEKRNRRILKRR